MSQVLISIQQVVILMVEIGVGFAVARLDAIRPGALSALTFLVVNVGLPCAIVSSVAGLEVTPSLWVGLAGALALIVGATLLQAAVSNALFRAQPAGRASVYRLATVYGNSAFMGIPLVAALVGQDFVVYATLMVIVDSVALFAHAPLIMSGKRPTPRFILSRIFGPVTIAMLIGLALLASGIELPGVLSTCLADFKGLVTPLAMIIVGCQLAEQNLAGVFSCARRYGVAAFKLVVWPLAIVLILAFTSLRALAVPGALAAIVICKATPQAAVFGVLAQEYHADAEEAAALVGLCTILSVVTLPVVAGLVPMIFGLAN